MKILIIEDDDDKAKDLAKFVTNHYKVDCTSISRSFQSGLRVTLESSHDLILLDMTMRNYDRTVEEEGGRPHHFAGREILRQMKRENIKVPVVIVTHFERFGEENEEVTLNELKEELISRFPNYLGTVHYRSNVDEWKEQLMSLLEGLLPEAAT